MTALAREQSLEEALRFAQAAFGKDDRLCSACRVGDVALLMQPIQRVQVVTFPDAHLIVTAEQEERQHGLVDLVRVGGAHGDSRGDMLSDRHMVHSVQ